MVYEAMFATIAREEIWWDAAEVRVVEGRP
jgi:hypothetical protein